MRTVGMTLKPLFASRLAKAIILAGAVAVSVGIWIVVDRLTQPAGSDVVMVVTHKGSGLCADGPCLDVSQRIYTDGRFEHNAKLTAAEMQQLTDTISRTDFTAYSSNPDPRCNSFSDGRDLSLAFPGKYDDREFVPCLLTIPKDDTGIRAIITLLDKHITK